MKQSRREGERETESERERQRETGAERDRDKNRVGERERERERDSLVIMNRDAPFFIMVSNINRIYKGKEIIELN